MRLAQDLHISLGPRQSRVDFADGELDFTEPSESGLLALFLEDF